MKYQYDQGFKEIPVPGAAPIQYRDYSGNLRTYTARQCSTHRCRGIFWAVAEWQPRRALCGRCEESRAESAAAREIERFY